jgi:hypothetical protein
MPTHQEPTPGQPAGRAGATSNVEVPRSFADEAASITPEEARSIAKEAVIYGFPLVDNLRIQYEYFVDTADPDYKAPYNHLVNIPRVYTPEDKAVQTPNSDTPYSWIGFDLRAEPMVLTIPPIEKDRYWSIQLIDLYTFNFDYLGSRATGNDGGSFAVAGPGWRGPTPPGVKKVISCETEIAIALYRTQLFDPADLDNVKRIQSQYVARPLSAFLGSTAPSAPSPIEFMKPLSPDAERTSIDFFARLDFGQRFCPIHPTETGLRGRLSRLGIGGGDRFDSTVLSPEMRQALEGGMADAWAAFTQFKAEEIDTGKFSSADGFGTRAFLKNDYMGRMAAAVLGIYGNSKEEAIYPVYATDAQGAKLDGAHSYRLRFGPGELPPVNAFWSLTMYQLPASLLYANPINRYLINSPMLPSLSRDPDGGITIWLQNQPPGKDQQANWLPAPPGPFWAILRLYSPKTEALDGSWTSPPLLGAD